MRKDGKAARGPGLTEGCPVGTRGTAGRASNGTRQQSGTLSGCGAFARSESGGVAALDPRLRSGIPSGWTQQRKRGTNGFRASGNETFNCTTGRFCNARGAAAYDAWSPCSMESQRVRNEIWHTFRVLGITSLRIRGCRCAQPPATVWHPFGMDSATKTWDERIRASEDETFNCTPAWFRDARGAGAYVGLRHRAPWRASECETRSGTPSGCGAFFALRIRGCRCAQPPATVWHPFGMHWRLQSTRDMKRNLALQGEGQRLGRARRRIAESVASTLEGCGIVAGGRRPPVRNCENAFAP